MAVLETKSWVQQFVEGEEGEWFVVVQEFHSGQLRFTDYHGPCGSEEIATQAKNQHTETFSKRVNVLVNLVARSLR